MKTTWYRKIQRISFTEIMLWIEASILLAFARFLVWALPFKYWVKLIGQSMSTTRVYEQEIINYKTRLKIAWAVKSAAYRVPWQAVCLPQAMAAKWMLGFRGQSSKLYLGVKPALQGSRGMSAHAWLQCCGDMITGGDIAEEFANVSHFI